MYVYVRDNMIIHRSRILKHDDFLKGSTTIIVDCKDTDKLILEGGQVKIYENSNQYIEDTNRYHLTKELEHTKKKNKELEIIANTKIKSERKYKKNKEPTEYEKKLYILKNLGNA